MIYSDVMFTKLRIYRKQKFLGFGSCRANNYTVTVTVRINLIFVHCGDEANYIIKKNYIIILKDYESIICHYI